MNSARRLIFGLVPSLAVLFSFHVSAASADTCPNAAFRTGPSASLPDCRAYEQVSPVFKNGYPITYSYLVGGGSRLVAGSLGAAAGDNPPPSALNGNFDLARSGSGWTITPLDASLAQFAYGAPIAAPALLSDAGATLLSLRPVSSSVYESDLYLRGADGSLALVGPTLPSSALPPTPTGSITEFKKEDGGELVGATPDLSHVLFRLNAIQAGDLPPGIISDLWPGDTTISGPRGLPFQYSLYEYVGTGNTEPALVGVSGGHGSHILISRCATFLGGPGTTGNKHNAISVEGSPVFFTAVGEDESNCGGVEPPVGEIFARIDAARTVAISEPSPSECGAGAEPAEEQCRSAPPADANFEGASADGSKVFFTSTQKLLDGASEDSAGGDSASRGGGGCRSTSGANGCNLYLHDFAHPEGHNLIDVSAGDTSGQGPRVQGVGAVSEDGSHVYFVAKGVLTETPNEYGHIAKAGEDNLYVYDVNAATKPTKFIATLAPGSLDSPQWTSNGEVSANLGPMSATPDGRFLVFTSAAALTPDDTSTVAQAFRYDAATDQLVRVSIGNEGFNSDGNTKVFPASIQRQTLSQVTGVKDHLKYPELLMEIPHLVERATSAVWGWRIGRGVTGGGLRSPQIASVGSASGASGLIGA